MKVQLLYAAGCPHVGAARTALRDALAAAQLDAPIDELDVDDPATPAALRRWGSPTILIDGVDVAGQGPQDGSTCRLYPGGAPSVAAIRDRIAAVSAGARPS